MTNATEANSWNGVAWAPAPISLFCAVSRTGTNKTMTSADGILWTPRVASTGNDQRGITYSSNLGLFVSVAANGSGNQVMTSNISLINRLGSDSIAIGYRAGRYSINSGDTIAIGREAGEGTVGSDTGGQAANAIAIGQKAGRQTQGVNSIAIGLECGQTSQGSNSVAYGRQAGRFSQGTNAVAVGWNAGNANQSGNSVAIGVEAGQTSQGSNSVAYGRQAGQTSQGATAVAIGNQSGQSSQGANSVAIGNLAGQTSQPDRTIILNATGVALNGTPTQTDSAYMAPIRSRTNTELLYYNNGTKEITRNNIDSIWANVGADITTNFIDVVFNEPVGSYGSLNRVYSRIGNMVFGTYYITFPSVLGGSLGMGSNPALILPFDVDIPSGDIVVGEFKLQLSSVKYFGLLSVEATDKTRANMRIYKQDTTYISTASLNVLNPEFSTNGGSMSFTFQYRLNPGFVPP
jgi:hypothetical protein